MDPSDGAVGPDDLLVTFPRQAIRERLAERGGTALPPLGRVVAAQLLRVVERDRLARVPAVDAAHLLRRVQRPRADGPRPAAHVGDALREAQLRLAFTQLPLGALLLRDVAEDDERVELAAPGLDHRRGDDDREQRSVATSSGQLTPRGARLLTLLEEHARCGVVDETVRPPAPAHLGLGEAVRTAGCRVGADDRSAAPRDEHAVDAVLEQ